MPCLSRKEGAGPRQSGAHVGMGVPRWDGIVAVSPRASVSMSCDRRDRRSAQWNGTGAGLRPSEPKVRRAARIVKTDCRRVLCGS